MLMLILGTIVATFLFYYYVVKHYDYWKDQGVKQGNPKWIFGDNWGPVLRKQSFTDFIQYIYNLHRGVRYSGIYQFFNPTLVLKDPDLIKQITVKDFDHFTDHFTFIPEDTDPLSGKNLFALRGQNWRDMRAILSPSFTSSKMRTMFVLISECAENFVLHFLKKNEDVLTVELKDTFTRFTNDVIASTAFGIKVDSLDEPNNEFYLMGRETTNFASIWKTFKFFGYLLFPRLFKGMKGTQKHEKEENGVIDTGFSTAQESDLVKSAKPPKNISDIDIAAQAMIFFFGGFETVSSLMCFLAYELTINVEVQEKLREEILSTMNECGGKLTYEVLLEMKYMDMVVSETLRKWPPAVATDRLCTIPYTIEPTKPDERPIHLNKGQSVLLPVYGIHHDPEYYPDPERFDPERFSDENKDNIKPYTYFPFGLGPRNCIGSRFALLETKTVIFHILRNFELVPVEKSEIPLQISKKQFNLTAAGGFWFGLKRISVRR